MNLRDCLVRSGIVNSRRVCRLRLATQLFFRNVLHACDGAGRFLADADDLRLSLYQSCLDRVSRGDVSRWMAECHLAGLIKLYTGPDGIGYGEVLNYGQRDTKRKVLYPAPGSDQLDFASVTADVSAPARPSEVTRSKSTAPPASAAPLPAREVAPDAGRAAGERRRRKELNRREGGAREARETPPPPPRAEDESEQAWKARLAALYPDVDIADELKAAAKKRRATGAKVTREWFEDHWLPNCGTPVSDPAAPAPKVEVFAEVPGWQALLVEIYPPEEHAATRRILASGCWIDVPQSVRRDIARRAAEKK